MSIVASYSVFKYPIANVLQSAVAAYVQLSVY